MSWKKSVIIGATLFFWVLCLASNPDAEAQEKKVVRINGAGLLSDAVQTYADACMKEMLGCSFVVTGATTGIGFQKLMDGDVEIAMVTRKITEQETKSAESRGLALNSRLIGQISLAVITNARNPVNELNMDQLAKIFKGEIANWAQVGGPDEAIRVTVRAVPETGAGVLFQDEVLKGAPYAKDSVVMNSYNTTVMVCSKAYAIGYIPTTTVYFDKLGDRGVKIIKIKKDDNSPPYSLAGGVSKQTSYPISVPFLMYWNSKSNDPCLHGLVDFSERQPQ